jgi:hypothetical protein
MTNEISYEVGSFQTAMGHLADQLLGSTPVHIGEWQSTDVSKSQLHATYELADVSLYMNIPSSPEGLRKWTNPFVNKVWAEEHFLERVGGNPVNPPPSHERWPWARHNGNHQKDDQFSHTYPERMWPKFAGERLLGDYFDGTRETIHNKGIRFAYGDLSDVVDLLVRNPLTRQAYLPIWFPEDTGAVHRERVPCTLGYHFMFRDNVLSCRYYMRSCDLIRHFADDVYLASRLTQWVHEEWQQRVTFKAMTLNPEVRNWAAPATQVGRLIMHISSLHAFVGDAYKLKELAG